MKSDRATEIKLIHVGRRELRLSEDEYRAMLFGVTGQTSAAVLDGAQRQRVLGRMREMGFAVRPKPAAEPVSLAREAQLRKLRAMWYALADVKAVERPADAEACNLAIEAWAVKRLPALTKLRFARGDDMAELIEQLKAWGDRVGAAVHGATPRA